MLGLNEKSHVFKKIGNTTLQNVCDFTACNGLKFKRKIFGRNFTFGECQTSLEKKDDRFCFVNEKSICEKIPSNIEPGTYVSTLPCEDKQDISPTRSREYVATNLNICCTVFLDVFF